MKPAVTSRARWAVFAFASTLTSTLSISAQSAVTNGAAQVSPSSSFEISASASPLETEGQVYREIDDPHTGEKWLLLRNSTHPGGPGRLVLGPKPQTAQSSAELPAISATSVSKPHLPAPIILAGDELIVERETTIVDERFEAVALEPAVKGSFFNVRLKVGGKVVRAVAQAPGRAVLDSAPASAFGGAK